MGAQSTIFGGKVLSLYPLWILYEGLLQEVVLSNSFARWGQIPFLQRRPHNKFRRLRALSRCGILWPSGCICQMANEWFIQVTIWNRYRPVILASSNNQEAVVKFLPSHNDLAINKDGRTALIEGHESIVQLLTFMQRSRYQHTR